MTRQINIGGVKVGGGAKITVQSMTNTNTADTKSTVEQILRLEDAGCDIVRVAVPDMEAANAIADIKKQIHIPIVADIHFDYRLALQSIKSGVDKVRINPGNILEKEKIAEVVENCKVREIPIRIGVNNGALTKELYAKHGGATPDALVECAFTHIDILENLNFDNIAVSIKASNVPVTIESYRKISKLRDYPLHIGVTETGTSYMGIIKSAAGIGTLLSEGIGDTIRVSLTDDPVEEIRAGIAILKALRIRDDGVEIISCPSCGRCRIDLISLAKEVEKRTADIKKNLKIAVMGCVVNGPGEARDADFGITGGDGVGMIYKKGEIYKKVEYDKLVDELMLLV